MVMVKTTMTMTPNSREDNNFHKDDEPQTSMKMIAKMTPTTATVKTIATTTAPMTMTPDSHEDDNFHMDNCKYDTHNGDSEDDHDYNPCHDPMTYCMIIFFSLYDSYYDSL